MKETEDNTNKWEDTLCSWIGRITTVQMNIQTKAIQRFNTIPIKMPMAFFTQLEQIILAFVQNHRKVQIDKAI